MRNSILAVLAGVLLLLPIQAWALHPFEIEQTDTQGKGNFLFELNGDLVKDNDLKTTTVSGVFTAGPGKNTDLSVEVPYMLLDPGTVTGQYERGAASVRLMLRQRLFENEVRQSMGFTIYSDIPTGYHTDTIGRRRLLWGASVTDQQGCCNYILRLSAGYEVLGGNIKSSHYNDDYAIRFGVASEYKLAESFRLLAEFAGQSRKETDPDTDQYAFSRPFTFMAGFHFDLSQSWYFDLCGRAGLNKYAEDYTVLTGTAWKF